MKVKDAMHTGVTWVEPTALVSDIARKMREQDIGAIPVGENDRLIGMVTDRDIVCRGLADGRDPAGLTARDVMSTGMSYCQAEDNVDDAIKAMREKHIRRLTVIGANKRMVGMLSMGDISHAADKAHCLEYLQSVSSHHA